MSLIAATLILSSGLLPSAGAQQRSDALPAYNSDSPPRQQESTPVTPEPLIRPNLYAGSQSPAPAVGPDGLPPDRLLQIHNDQGIRHVSGGVGESERIELNALSNQFNLRLMFAMQGSGEYLSAVRVNILDTHGGSILNTEAKGPWLLAQLASGDYTVEASVPSQVQQPQRQTVHIESSHQSRLDFYWR
jgi:hypothetical protein